MLVNESDIPNMMISLTYQPFVSDFVAAASWPQHDDESNALSCRKGGARLCP